MQNSVHPDDERLAAYAGGDADALADRALAEHLTACDRCRPIVEELTLLRGALADLPDIAPSRPLRLIPPVPSATAPRAGRLEWLRRLAAPAMGAGAVLVLVGAIGASGIVGGLGQAASAGGALEAASASDAAKAPSAARESTIPAPEDNATGSAFDSQTFVAGSQPDRAGQSAEPTSSPDQTLFAPVTNTPEPPQPWTILLIGGIALFAVAAALRYSLRPRAG